MIDTRSKSAKVRAAYGLAQERGRPVPRGVIRLAVDIRTARPDWYWHLGAGCAKLDETYTKRVRTLSRYYAELARECRQQRGEA